MNHPLYIVSFSTAPRSEEVVGGCDVGFPVREGDGDGGEVAKERKWPAMRSYWVALSMPTLD